MRCPKCGFPIVEEEQIEELPRCVAVLRAPERGIGGVRCQLPPGHGGVHRWADITWMNSEGVET